MLRGADAFQQGCHIRRNAIALCQVAAQLHSLCHAGAQCLRRLGFQAREILTDLDAQLLHGAVAQIGPAQCGQPQHQRDHAVGHAHQYQNGTDGNGAPVLESQLGACQRLGFALVQMRGQAGQQLGLVFSGTGLAAPVFKLQLNALWHFLPRLGRDIAVGIQNPVARVCNRKALRGPRDMRGFGVHGCIGQQLGEVHLRVQRFALQVVAALGGTLVAAFLNDQPAQLFLAAQWKLLIVKAGDQLGQQVVHCHQHAAGRLDLPLEDLFEMLQHRRLHGGFVERRAQRTPGRTEARQMGIVVRMVCMGGLGAQGVAPLAALRLGKSRLLRQFFDPGGDALGAQLCGVGVEDTIGHGVDHHHGLAVELVWILESEVAVQPGPVGFAAAGTAGDQGKEQRGLFVVTAHRFGQCTLGQVAIVSQPGGQGHQGRCQPVAGGGEHQLFRRTPDGFLAHQLNVGGLQDAGGLAAHHGVLPEGVFDFLADLHLAGFGQRQFLGLEVGFDEVRESLLQARQFGTGLRQVVADVVHLVGDGADIALQGAKRPENQGQVCNLDDAFRTHRASRRRSKVNERGLPGRADRDKAGSIHFNEGVSRVLGQAARPLQRSGQAFMGLVVLDDAAAAVQGMHLIRCAQIAAGHDAKGQGIDRDIGQFIADGIDQRLGGGWAVHMAAGIELRHGLHIGRGTLLPQAGLQRGTVQGSL